MVKKQKVELVGKKELAAIIADENGITKKAAAEAIDFVTDAVRTVLRQEKAVRLSGFGSITPVFKEAHTRVNNLNGESIEVAAGFRYKAKVSKQILAA